MNRGLTVAQVARVVGVEDATVRSWLKRRHLTRNKWGRIGLVELLAYLDARGTRGQRIEARRHLGM